MKIFIKFLCGKEIINNKTISLFSFCESIDEMNLYLKFNESEILEELYSPFSENDFNEIIAFYNKNKNNIKNIDNLLFKELNKLMIKNKNPSFKKTLKSFKKFINFLNDCNDNNFSFMKKSNKEIMKILKK